MQLRTLVRGGACLTALFAMSAAWSADDAATVLAKCRAQSDAGERLACYDREADRLMEKTAATGSTPAAAKPETAVAGQKPAAAASQQAATSKDENFGSRGGALARAETEQKLEEAKGLPPPKMVARVTKVSSGVNGEVVMYLDNGQVWTQKKVQRNFNVKPGEEVRIEPGLLGSFMLWVADSNRTTRVTRLR